MPFFSGFAQGASDELSRQRQLQAQQNEADAARENAALTHLASSPDPEIAAHALTGLLSQSTSTPGKGMLSRLFGKTAQNPMLPTIKGLIQSGRQVPREPAPSQLPEGASAALPAGSLVDPGFTPHDLDGASPLGAPRSGIPEPGGPPLSMAAIHNTLPQARGETATVPRRVFRTPDEQARLTEEAQIGGKLSALRPYLTPEQQSRAALGEAGVRGNISMRFVPGANPGTNFPQGTLDVDGNPITPQGYYRTQEILDPITQTITRHHIPTATPTALQVKPTHQVLAGPDGRPHLFRVMPDQSKVDLGEKPVRDGYVTYTDPDTQEVKSVVAPAVFERPRGTVTPPPGAPAAAGTVPPPAGAPAARPTTRTGTPTAGAAPTGPPASTASTSPKGVARGRVRALTPTEGAVLGPDGQPQVTTAHYDKGTGKYYDPTNPGRELAGFIPGKEGAEVVKTIANTNSVETTLDRAIQAITDLKLDGDGNPNTTAGLVNKYRAGGGEDPLASAFNALADFAKIQGASQYVQGTRAFRYIQQIQQHLPLLPSTKEAAANTLTAGIVSPSNTLVRAVAGTTWDSPKQMVQKLEQAKLNLANIRTELTKAAGKTPARAIGQDGGSTAAPPPAGPSSGPIAMRAPDGRALQVPASEVERLKALGAVVVQ